VTQHQRSHIRGPYRQKSPYTTMDKILMMAVLLFILFVALVADPGGKHVP
jgi:hypothetical protein